ncbi:DUF6069 family protein [Geodermatophilus sp. SYSU D00766]
MFSTEHTLVSGRRSLVLTVLATAAAVATFSALRLSGQELVVAARGDPRPVPVGAVVLATVAGGVAAHVLARSAARTGRPRRTFLAAVVAGLALSGVPPVQAATTTSTAVWLLVLHAVVAAVLVPPLARALPPTRPPAQRRPEQVRPGAGVPR